MSLLRLFSIYSELKNRGILGINRRNAEYMLPLNKREFYPRVDDKLLTKILCQESGIPVPEMYCEINHFGQLTKLSELLSDLNDFVVKPASGAGGRGVMVIFKHDGIEFETAYRDIISIQDIHYHISTILSGLFSLGGQPDSAIIERRIIKHPVFDNIAVGGTPDIRVIVFKGVPVMSMLRLPTQLSRGRANLHQGAIAAGINLLTGTANVKTDMKKMKRYGS